MIGTARRRVFSLIALGIFSAAGLSQAQDERQLQQLRARIAALEQELEQDRGQRDALHDELRAAERAIGTQLQQLRRLEAQRRVQHQRLRSVRAEQARQQRRLEGVARGLEGQARAAYAMGRQSYLKMLLSQGDPAALQRAVVYYRYLYDARRQRLAQTRSALVQLRGTEQTLAQDLRQLAALQAEEAAKRDLLALAQTQRKQVLAHIDTRLRDRAERVEQLRKDEQRLARLITGIEPLLPALPAGEGRFREYRGRLPLPLAAKIVAFYGSPRQPGNLRWRGVFLAASPGQEVRAIFRGRVAYADWLRGFGLLLILEHGDGYMTLYGHNQSLYKRIGEWVEAGEVIAGVGNTGGFPEPGLYFEIRHHGEPHDPLQWCRR